MSKNLSAKYYQENKKRLKKLAPERYQNLSKEEEEEEKKKKQKKKRRKTEKRNWLSIEKNII